MDFSGTEEPEEPEETDDPEEVGGGVDFFPSLAAVPAVLALTSESLWVYAVHSEEDALKVATPSKVNQNYASALVLARAVKALEAQAGEPFTPDRHRSIHSRWLVRAAAYLRPGLSPEEYLLEYLNA